MPCVNSQYLITLIFVRKDKIVDYLFKKFPADEFQWRFKSFYNLTTNKDSFIAF